MVHRIAEPLLGVLLVPVGAELEIFVDRTGNDAKMQLLRRLWFALYIEGMDVLGTVAQPFVKD
jgi:hypothetical protein